MRIPGSPFIDLPEHHGNLGLWKGRADAAWAVADTQRELAHQGALIEIAEREVEARRKTAVEAQKRASSAAEVLAKKEADLRRKRERRALRHSEERSKHSPPSPQQAYSELDEDNADITASSALRYLKRAGGSMISSRLREPVSISN
ncbi:hypothetical protein CF326_g9849 [Tilletia indica]|nr:hypothetical protein CF326_g9849 [Tilletia indica]